MKKTVLASICVLLLFSGCANNISCNQLLNAQSGCKISERATDMNKSILVYGLTREQYYSFLNSPSFEVLEKDSVKLVYSIVENDSAMIERQYFEGKSLVKERYKEGIYRINFIPIYISLINFWSSTTKIENYLNENNVTGSVENVAFIYSTGLPVCIWVSTKYEHYFISIDEYVEDYEYDIHSDTYTYRLYTQEAFFNKVGVVDAKIIINGSNILSIKMHYDYAEIPLISLLMKLGANVSWTDEIVSVSYNDNNIEIDIKNQSVIYDENIELKLSMPGDSSCFYLENHELYVDDHVASIVISALDVKFIFDRSNRIIYVNCQ